MGANGPPGSSQSPRSAVSARLNLRLTRHKSKAQIIVGSARKSARASPRIGGPKALESHIQLAYRARAASGARLSHLRLPGASQPPPDPRDRKILKSANVMARIT